MTRVLIALLLGLVQLPAGAHQLQLFAWAEGEQIQGQVYFVGGRPLARAEIRLLDSNNQILRSLRSDSEGHFQLPRPAAETLQIIADSGDGHRASWSLTQERLGITQTDTAPASPITTSRDALDQRIEAAIARQLGPLRAELQAHARSARLADIIGGLGLIIGLAGGLLWWRARRTRQRP